MAYFRCGGGGGAKVTLNGEPNTDSWAITYKGSTYSYPLVEIANNDVNFSEQPRVAFNNSIYVFCSKTIYSWSEGMEYWITLGELPSRCYEAVIYNGMIYLLLDNDTTNKVYAYNGLHMDAGGTLTEIIECQYYGMCVVKDQIYAFDGTYDNGIVLGVYNGSTITTKRVPYSLLNEYHCFRLFNYKNELHLMDLIVAGSEGTLSSHKHCKYNEYTNTVTVICEVPYVTSGSYSHSPDPDTNSCQLGERFYIISDNPYAPCEIAKYDWYFDGSVWKKIGSNTLPNPNPTAVTYKNSIYTLGGYNSYYNRRYIDIIPNYSVTKVE